MLPGKLGREALHFLQKRSMTPRPRQLRSLIEVMFLGHPGTFDRPLHLAPEVFQLTGFRERCHKL